MKKSLLSVISFIVAIIIANPVSAQVIPRSTDAGRVGIEQKQELPEPPTEVVPIPEVRIPGVKVPEGAKNIKFTLNQIMVQGVTIFYPEQIEPLYKEYIGKEISLDTVWQIADSITKYYQDKGYFISRAYVPAQEVGKDGVIIINVVEGYISVVELDDQIANNYVVKKLIKKLKKEKPINIKTLEDVTLRLNDIHSGSFRSIIEPLQADQNEGGIKLILVKEKKKVSGSVSFDNYNSMFLGPYQGTVNLEASLLNQNQTSVTYLNSMPWDKLKYFSANHNIVLLPELSIDLYGGYTEARPGYTLSANDIESDSSNIGTSLNIQPIRQRQENLVFRMKLDKKDVSTDVLRTALTRDHIRVARLNAAYDRNDFLSGYNFINATWSHGLTAFDASERRDANLSRQGVDPKFKKLELNWNRFQSIGNWMGVTSTAMQFAKGPQYSSEQFGYGGQAYGRAYDPSDIVGDQGMLAALELRYIGLPAWEHINFVPYGFYDVGKIWSVNDVSASRSSTGAGMRIDSGTGLFGNLTIAQPIIHKITTPPYGNGKNPRLLAQMGFKF